MQLYVNSKYDMPSGRVLTGWRPPFLGHVPLGLPWTFWSGGNGADRRHITFHMVVMDILKSLRRPHGPFIKIAVPMLDLWISQDPRQTGGFLR